MQEQDIPYGYCQCGCGEKAPLADQTYSRSGYIKGQPVRYIANHHNRGRKLTAEQQQGLNAARMLRQPLSVDARRRISESKKGELHPLWQGDEANYYAVHKWLRRNYPKTGRCEWCGTTSSARTEYAFLKGVRGITRNREDYAELCTSCHRTYDAQQRREARNG